VRSGCPPARQAALLEAVLGAERRAAVAAHAAAQASAPPDAARWLARPPLDAGRVVDLEMLSLAALVGEHGCPTDTTTTAAGAEPEPGAGRGAVIDYRYRTPTEVVRGAVTLQRWARRALARRRRGREAKLALSRRPAAAAAEEGSRAGEATLPGASSTVSRPFPSWDRSILTEITLCHACSCRELLRTETAGQSRWGPWAGTAGWALCWLCAGGSALGAVWAASSERFTPQRSVAWAW
jgi:hypothetical protein